MATVVTTRHVILHALRIVLLLTLVLLSINLPSTLHHLATGGADMFRVSPFLLPALLFKAVLLSINVLLLWLAHRAIKRLHASPRSLSRSSDGVPR